MQISTIYYSGPIHLVSGEPGFYRDVNTERFYKIEEGGRETKLLFLFLGQELLELKNLEPEPPN